MQAEIAAQLKVSTTPVREALRDLASDQLIRFHPHRGAIVHELNMEELRELYEIRKALEPLAIRLAAASRITKEKLKEASELQTRMEKELDPGAWVRVQLEVPLPARKRRGITAPRGVCQERAGLVGSVRCPCSAAGSRPYQEGRQRSPGDPRSDARRAMASEPRASPAASRHHPAGDTGCQLHRQTRQHARRRTHGIGSLDDRIRPRKPPSPRYP